MKTKLLFFSILLIQFADAQIINFSDVNFKNALLNTRIDYNGYNTNNDIIYPNVDANNDGEISVDEALLVKGLYLGYAQLDNLEGLQFFTNLEKFETLFFNGTSFNFPTLTNLKRLKLSNAVSGFTGITSLDLSSNINLENISCNVNGPIVNLDNLNELKDLSLFGTFTQIDLSDATNLLFLSLNAPLTELNLTNNTKLINIVLSDTDFLDLDLSACTNLEIVYANNGEMETLNLGEIKYVRYLFVQDNNLTSLNTDSLFNLQNLNCDNNNLNYLSIKNKGLIFADNSGISFAGNPNLETICCDVNEIVYVQNICNTLDYDTIVSNCAPTQGFVPPITMFPNPVKDVLQIDSIEKINKVEVFAVNGFLIMSIDSVRSGIIDMNTLQSGIYFLKVYRNSGISQMKFAKG